MRTDMAQPSVGAGWEVPGYGAEGTRGGGGAQCTVWKGQGGGGGSTVYGAEGTRRVVGSTRVRCGKDKEGVRKYGADNARDGKYGAEGTRRGLGSTVRKGQTRRGKQ
jgi:hypothetical protein